MSLTATVISTEVVGKTRVVVADVTFDSSYLTGGELFPPSLLGMYSFSSVSPEPSGTNATHVAIPVWNRLQGTLSTLKAFWGDNANASPAQLIEVASTTDLSALTVRVEARGA